MTTKTSEDVLLELVEMFTWRSATGELRIEIGKGWLRTPKRERLRGIIDVAMMELISRKKLDALHRPNSLAESQSKGKRKHPETPKEKRAGRARREVCKWKYHVKTAIRR